MPGAHGAAMISRHHASISSRLQATGQIKEQAPICRQEAPSSRDIDGKMVNYHFASHNSYISSEFLHQAFPSADTFLLPRPGKA